VVYILALAVLALASCFVTGQSIFVVADTKVQVGLCEECVGRRVRGSGNWVLDLAQGMAVTERLSS
jgi:hypothetical protein